MASTADIARLLNFDDLDNSAFADVFTDYFGDRERREEELEEHDFLD